MTEPSLALKSAFPDALRSDAELVEAQLVQVHPRIGAFEVSLSSGPVSIPYRLYLAPPPEAALTARQRVILDCLFTRDWDGHVRQAHLGRLLGSSDEWVCPFVWVLLGEYVVEIVELIRAHAERLDHARYAAFLAGNPRFTDLTRQRAISYWNCYYRGRFPSFEQYPACQVFARFGVAPRARQQR